MQTKLFVTLLSMLAICQTYAAVYDLDTAIAKVRENCSGLESKMDHLKLMAGINTGIGVAGTVTGGVALGTGIAKEQKDKQSALLLGQITVKLAEQHNTKLIDFVDKHPRKNNETDEQYTKRMAIPLLNEVRAQYAEYIKNKEQFKETKNGTDTNLVEEKEKIDSQSKALGNVRTGMLAVNTATNIAGAVTASQNKTKGSIKKQIEQCIAATDDLKDSIMQARIENQDTTQAKRILDACGSYRYADLSKIDKLATGATVTSSIGAITGGVGTITSAMANTDSTRNGDVITEFNLNTASNVLSGVTTVTSAVSTVLNGVQIATIKKVVSIANNCEQELQ